MFASIDLPLCLSLSPSLTLLFIRNVLGTEDS